MSTPVAPRLGSRRRAAPRKGDQRELALLTAADNLVRAGRFTEASVTDLAASAGLSRASFYFYFSSKEDLLVGVVDRAVEGFNETIARVLDPTVTSDPAMALRRSVEAAADLWWDHSAVLVASVELGTRIPAVYDNTQANLAVVREPTVALLRRAGRVPEADDPDEADALVLTLTLLSERTFFHVMRSNPTRDEWQRARDRIARIWLRAFGLIE